MSSDDNRPAETEADVDLSAEVAVIERILRNADLTAREVEALRAVVVQATESTKWVDEGETRWDMAEALGFELVEDAPSWRDLRDAARLAATPPAPEGEAGDPELTRVLAERDGLATLVNEIGAEVGVAPGQPVLVLTSVRGWMENARRTNVENEQLRAAATPPAPEGEAVGVFAAIVPPQPEHVRRVLDSDGDAWRFYKRDQWAPDSPAVSDLGDRSWAALVAEFGPLTPAPAGPQAEGAGETEVRRVLADRGYRGDEPVAVLLARVLDELGARPTDPYGAGDGSYPEPHADGDTAAGSSS